MTAARWTSQRPPPAATMATVAGGGDGRRKLTILAITDKKRNKRTRSYHHGLRPTMCGCSSPCTDVQPPESMGESAVKTAPAETAEDKTPGRRTGGRWRWLLTRRCPIRRRWSPDLAPGRGWKNRQKKGVVNRVWRCTLCRER